jgi:hypothetical protein
MWQSSRAWKRYIFAILSPRGDTRRKHLWQVSMEEALKLAERTGRPLGSDSFLLELENTLDRTLKKKPGPKTC